MSDRAAAWLAWALWVLTVALAATYVLLGHLNGSSGAWVVEQLISTLLPVATLPAVGALVAARRPRNAMGWLILSIVLSFAASSFTYQYALYALVTAPGALPAGSAMAWLSTWTGVPGGVVLVTFFFLLFPTGRLPSPRWRTLAWFVGAMLVLSTLTSAFTPGNAGWPGSPVRNPLGIESAGPFLAWFNTYSPIVGIPIGLLCAMSNVLRYRRARGEERQQLKWFAWAVLLIAFVFSVDTAVGLNPVWSTALPAFIFDLLFSLVLSLAALAIGLAILKYRLYDIDVLIRRTLIYSVLSVALALVYFGSVALLQELFRALTGQRSDLAVVASTLAIAALFTPLRHRIQAGIDRRFYRRKYDAQKAMESFSITARDEVDTDQLSATLLDTVEETMQPERVVLWIRLPEKR